MNSQEKLRFSFLLCALFVSCSSNINAAVFGTSTDNLDGTWTYEYTIDNTAGTFDIFAFALNFNFSADPITGYSEVGGFNFNDIFNEGDVDVPIVGFWASGVSPADSSTLEFANIDPFWDGDVLIDSSLEGFSFTSSLAPTTMIGWDVFGSLGESYSGMTIGPAAVPEPSSIAVLMGLGALSLCWMIRRQKVS